MGGDGENRGDSENRRKFALFILFMGIAAGIVVVVIIVTLAVSALNNSSDSPRWSPAGQGAQDTARGNASGTGGGSSAGRDAQDGQNSAPDINININIPSIPDIASAVQSATGAETGEESLPEQWKDWDISVAIKSETSIRTGLNSLDLVAPQMIDSRAENIWRLTANAEKFELVFDFSVGREIDGMYYDNIEENPNEVYRITVLGERVVIDDGSAREHQIRVEDSGGNVVMFKRDAERALMRVDNETGKLVDASDEPVWKLYGNVSTDDFGLVRFLAPALMFGATSMPTVTDGVEWMGMVCTSEKYVYRTSSSGAGMETSQNATVIGHDNLFVYFSEETGDWVGMRLNNNDIVYEGGLNFYAANQNADFRILEVRYFS